MHHHLVTPTRAPDDRRPAPKPASSTDDTTHHRGVLPRLVVTCGVLAAVTGLAVIVGLALGPVSVSPGEVLAILLDQVGLTLGDRNMRAQHESVIIHIRLPRVLVAALVGMALGISGTTMQAVFRNPLAEPGVIGISSGAALGAVAAIYFGWFGLSWWMLPAAAFAGAAATMLLVFAIAATQGARSSITLLLVGIGVSAMLGALISVMVATAGSDEELRGIVFWLQGGLGSRTWRHVMLAGIPILVGAMALATFGRSLNVLLLGDEAARALGMDVARERTVLLVLASLLTGAAVAVSGVIGFVGLVVPHAIRLLVGPDNRLVLPASALGGAAFLVLSDTIARTAFSPVSLQVGIVTALFGAPVFLVLVLRRSGAPA